MEVVKSISFKSFSEFWDAVSPNGKILKIPSGFIFRGESTNNKAYKLLPRALRGKDGVYQAQQIFNEINDLCEFYKEANFNSLVIPKNEFIPGYSPEEIMTKKGNTIFWLSDEFEEITSLAQHYGLPTRLLDWTRDIFTAFYFASTGVYSSCSLKKPDIGSTESMVIYALNYEYLASQIIKWRPSEECCNYKPMPIKFVIPHYANNANITAQSGILTYSEVKVCSYSSSLKADCIPLDEKLQNLADGNYDFYTLENPEILLYKFEIPVTEAGKMYHFISCFNYSYSKMFPGYSGITRSIEEKAFFKENHNEQCL